MNSATLAAEPPLKAGSRSKLVTPREIREKLGVEIFSSNPDTPTGISEEVTCAIACPGISFADMHKTLSPRSITGESAWALPLPDAKTRLSGWLRIMNPRTARSEEKLGEILQREGVNLPSLVEATWMVLAAPECFPSATQSIVTRTVDSDGIILVSRTSVAFRRYAVSVQRLWKQSLATHDLIVHVLR